MIVQKHSGKAQGTADGASLDDALASEAQHERDALAMLRLQLGSPDHALLNDEIVARIRGMLGDLARQIVLTEVVASGHRGAPRTDPARVALLAASFDDVPGLLEHCHALALEWQLTRKLEATLGIDPMLSPLLQALIGSEAAGVAEAAMAALTAQARFGQTQGRMELPLTELPADLFHDVLTAWKDASRMRGSDTAIRAEAKLRNAFDEGRTRLSLLSRLTVGLCEPSAPMPDLAEAGVALFFTVLAGRSGQSRHRAVLSSASPQSHRLAVSLRAAGLGAAAGRHILRQMQPQAELLDEVARLDPATARLMLAERAAHKAEA